MRYKNTKNFQNIPASFVGKVSMIIDRQEDTLQISIKSRVIYIKENLKSENLEQWRETPWLKLNFNFAKFMEIKGRRVGKQLID